MTAIILDNSFLNLPCDTDEAVQLRLADDSTVAMEIAVQGGSAVRLRLSALDCLKLGTSLYAIGKLASGQPIGPTGPAN